MYKVVDDCEMIISGKEITLCVVNPHTTTVINALYCISRIIVEPVSATEVLTARILPNHLKKKTTTTTTTDW